MKNKINFITGETYTLAELFSGNRKIIIPDLQRDYCWGDNAHSDEKKELVSGFVETLIQLFESKHSNVLNLGLIYGYESPENHIQLCDGQQRITTLYLLLGMLNKKSEQNSFRKFLISDYEYLQDDKEPYLQYAIRESSLYFLSDIVCHFFIKENEDRWYVKTCEEITKSSWFFNEYKLDPSIQSMIRALEKIDRKLINKDKEWIQLFGNFLISKLTFMYYDMENRKNGEETFVVINTTGEPLSNTQNLKPLIFADQINHDYIRLEANQKKNMTEDWEEIETWFWKKRKNNNDTADAGFNEFLRWITMLHACKSEKKEDLKQILSNGKYTFPVSKVSFQTIYSYWLIVKFIFESWEYKDFMNGNHLSPSVNKEIKDAKTIGQIDCFQLLPLIAYCKKWGLPESGDRKLLGLYQFVHNLARIDNVRKAVNELVYDVICIARSCEDITDLIGSNLKKQISATILTDEEKLKLEIIKSNPEHRTDMEESFWEAQDWEKTQSHEIWSGQIQPLIEWSTEEGRFNLKKFKKYLEIFDSTFQDQCDGNIDEVRRALLTRGLKEYPKVFRGNANYSFGWEWSDWNILINENKCVFKAFFDDLLQGTTKSQMIEAYDQSKDWAEFVHKEYLLAYCEKKNIQWKEELGWLLIKKQRTTKCFSVNNYHLEQYLKANLKVENWLVWIWNENRLVVENQKNDIVFDIWYQKNKWEIQFFKRKGDVKEKLGLYIDNTWNFNGERYEKSIEFSPVDYYNYTNVLELLRGILDDLS